MANRQEFTITVGVTAAIFVINTRENDGTEVSVTAEPTGLDDDFDIDLFEVNDITPVPTGSELTDTVGLTLALSNSNVRSTTSAAMTGDFLIGSLSGTATTGTVVLHVTFK